MTMPEILALLTTFPQHNTPWSFSARMCMWHLTDSHEGTGVMCSLCGLAGVKEDQEAVCAGARHNHSSNCTSACNDSTARVSSGAVPYLREKIIKASRRGKQLSHYFKLLPGPRHLSFTQWGLATFFIDGCRYAQLHSEHKDYTRDDIIWLIFNTETLVDLLQNHFRLKKKSDTLCTKGNFTSVSQKAEEITISIVNSFCCYLTKDIPFSSSSEEALGTPGYKSLILFYKLFCRTT